MIRVYGPGCEGEVVDSSRKKIPLDAAWIDLEEPTREDMSEIEPSSRLREQNGALYLTMNALYGVEEGQPSSDPITFVLTKDRLVTVRYVTPKPIRAFSEGARREPELAQDSLTALTGIFDAIVDRLADELENVGAEIEKISSHIFSPAVDARRIPAARLTALLTRIGKTQSLLAKIRETQTSTNRALTFLSGTRRLRARRASDAREHVASLTADTLSLGDHSVFLANHLYFLLDASVGLISIEQNAAMKLFSWAALVLLPPTLIGSIYGMNFRHMPELQWYYGYPLALLLMLASAVLPLWYLKRRGWL